MAKFHILTTQQEIRNPNPTGKGGFGDHPEHRNPGGWKPETSVPYQIKRFQRMSIQEFKDYVPKTMAEQTAYNAVANAPKNLQWFNASVDRSDGKPKQESDITSNGQTIAPVLVEFLKKEKTENEQSE